MLQLKFNAGLTLTAFRTTRPYSRYFVGQRLKIRKLNRKLYVPQLENYHLYESCFRWKQLGGYTATEIKIFW